MNQTIYVKHEKCKHRKKAFFIEEDDKKKHERESEKGFLKTVVENQSMCLETSTLRKERELSFSISKVN